ncbi:MAG: hypothetical protein ACOH1Q_04880, partial [Thiobacillus sp.]
NSQHHSRRFLRVAASSNPVLNRTLFRMPYTRAFGFWLVILVLAFLNGGLRELILIPYLGAPWALLASGGLLMLFVLLTAYVAAPRLGTTQVGPLLVIGGMWLGLTLGFEFGFGRLVQGKPWSELLNAYRFENGNIWPLVLLVVFFGPLLAARFRSARDHAAKRNGPA